MRIRSQTNKVSNQDPFGKRSCEQEVTTLGNQKYIELFFDEAPFNDVAIEEATYLIIGRRGSGKTSLARYFSFQTQNPNPLCIEVLQADAYEQVLSEISRRTSANRSIAVSHLKRVWEFIIWKLIADALPEEKLFGRSANSSGVLHRSTRVADLIKYLMDFFSESDESKNGPAIDRVLRDSEAELEETKKQAVRFAKKRPIFISIDTLEQYSIRDEALMNALAALIECAASFNLNYSAQNIHLKVFVSGEVFPHLKEAVILNPLKTVQHPVYLLWRPRDLLRLIGWRFYSHLLATGEWKSKVRIDWEDDDDVLEKIWIPHFGTTLKNGRGQMEESWTYVLRHTQMRPRQLIFICNSIANLAVKEGSFPNFTDYHIREGVRNAELELASEILNSYSEIYKNVDKIVTSALTTLPKVFTGNELDRRASQSASEWPDEYSPGRFKQLVAELGIIGRVTRNSYEAGYIDADFEYGSTERLVLTHHDECVVHPMFYRKLNVEINSDSRVMPFSTPR